MDIFDAIDLVCLHCHYTEECCNNCPVKELFDAEVANGIKNGEEN